MTEGGDPEIESLVEYGTFDPNERPLPEETPAADGHEGDEDSLFDPRHREDFHGLAYLGALTKSFEWLGHRFVIRTLTRDEELAIALIIKEWEGTSAEPAAYMTAIVALCTESVDGIGMPSPYEEAPGRSYAWAFQRFNHVKARWFGPTIDAVYTHYKALEERALEVLIAMGKASAPTDSMAGSTGS